MEFPLDPIALVASIALAALMLAIAIYITMRQRQTLAHLRRDSGLSLEDRRYLHRRAVMRLVSAAFLCILAFLVVGGVVLEGNLTDLHPEEPVVPPPESAKDSLRLLAAYWMGTVLVLMVVMVLAVFDWFATARYGARQRRQLLEESREALAAEVERIRRDRHGLNGESM
jgi:hypothetical protein